MTTLARGDASFKSLPSFFRERLDADSTRLLRSFSYAASTSAALAEAVSKSVSANTIYSCASSITLPYFIVSLKADQVTQENPYEIGWSGLIFGTSGVVFGENEASVYYGTKLPNSFTSFEAAQANIAVKGASWEKSQYDWNHVTRRFGIPTDPASVLSTDALGDYLVCLSTVTLPGNAFYGAYGWLVGTPEHADATQGGPAVEAAFVGYSANRHLAAVAAGAGWSYFSEGGKVLDVRSDGSQWIIETSGKITTVPSVSAVPSVSLDDEAERLAPTSSDVQIFEEHNKLSATATEVPGVALSVLDGATVLELTFANVSSVWEYSAGRPSEWRFPVGGSSEAVERFWELVDERCTASGVSLELVYGLPATVNPLHVVWDLCGSNLSFISVSARTAGTSCADVVAQYALQPSIVCQTTSPASDSIDLSSFTDQAGVAYLAEAGPDVISTSGTDLLLGDYAPFVALK